MNLRRYRGRHLKPRPRRRAPAALGTAAAVWASSPPAFAGGYTVRSGDTLSNIARAHGITVARLARLNKLSDPNLILAGQRLRVRARAAVASVHVVRPGETLSGIAARYGSSVPAIARANGISDVNLIFAGSRLQIPGGGATRGGERPADVDALLHRHAVGHGLDPGLVKAVAWHESGWRQSAVSHAGAIGVMQVMPGTADYVNSFHPGRDLDVMVADDNIHLGAAYLAHLRNTMTSENRALAAYYSGPGNVGRRLKPYQRHYVRTVQALRARF